MSTCKDDLSEGSLFIFVHIFKCGGTFFTGGLRYSYTPEQMCLANVAEDHPSFYWNKKEEERLAIKFYHGHVQFGIHETLCRPSIYLTVVRDPVDQLLSTYYNLREPKCSYHILHPVFHQYSFEECVTMSCLAKVTPEQALYLSYFMDNHQTRMLSGTYKTLHGWDKSEFRNTEISALGLKIDSSDYEVALNNVENNFSFVGVCNQTDYYWELLNRRFGFSIPEDVWVSSDWRFSNKTYPSRPRQEDFPAEVIDSVKNSNRHDQSIYEYVLSNSKRINSRPIVTIE